MIRVHPRKVLLILVGEVRRLPLSCVPLWQGGGGNQSELSLQDKVIGDYT